MAFCEKCGGALIESAGFCQQCGAGIADKTSASVANNMQARWRSVDSDVQQIVAGFVLVIALAGFLGIFGQASRPAGAVTSGAEVLQQQRDEAQISACYSNQRTVEGGAQTFYAEFMEYPESMAELVSKGYLNKAIDCPSGGTYEFDSEYGEIHCSVHDDY